MTDPRVSTALARTELQCTDAAGDREHEADKMRLLGPVLAGTLRVGAAEMWPVNLQVRWLSVVSRGFKIIPDSDRQTFERATMTLLNSLQAQPPHQVLPCASALAPLLPALLGMVQDSKVLAAMVGSAAAELRPSLFRLDLHDAWIVSRGFLQFGAKLRCNAPAEPLATVDEISALGRAMI